MQTFTWFIDAKASGDYEEQAASVQFGDGYELNVSEGVNSERKTWNASVIGDRMDPNDDYNKIKKFLREHGTTKSFLWTDPDGETLRYRRSAMKNNHEGANIFTLTFTLIQTYY